MPEEASSKYIVIGKIGSTYGVNGWLKIHTYTEFGANILHYSPWFLSIPGQDTYQEIIIEDGKPHGNSYIAKIADANNPEEARLYTGKVISIQRSQLPTLNQGEYYWSDLVGLTVMNTKGEVLGIVSYLIETGANDVLVIKGDKEHAIPYLPGSVVVNIDLAKKEMIVDWELI